MTEVVFKVGPETWTETKAPPPADRRHLGFCPSCHGTEVHRVRRSGSTNMMRCATCARMWSERR
jgi:hypothetical protein